VAYEMADIDEYQAIVRWELDLAVNYDAVFPFGSPPFCFGEAVAVLRKLQACGLSVEKGIALLGGLMGVVDYFRDFLIENDPNGIYAEAHSREVSEIDLSDAIDKLIDAIRNSDSSHIQPIAGAVEEADWDYELCKLLARLQVKTYRICSAVDSVMETPQYSIQSEEHDTSMIRELFSSAVQYGYILPFQDSTGKVCMPPFLERAADLAILIGEPACFALLSEMLSLIEELRTELEKYLRFREDIEKIFIFSPEESNEASVSLQEMLEECYTEILFPEYFAGEDEDEEFIILIVAAIDASWPVGVAEDEPFGDLFKVLLDAFFRLVGEMRWAIMTLRYNLRRAESMASVDYAIWD